MREFRWHIWLKFSQVKVEKMTGDLTISCSLPEITWLFVFTEGDSGRCPTGVTVVTWDLEDNLRTTFPCDHGLCAALGNKFHLFSVQVLLMLPVLAPPLLLYYYIQFCTYIFCLYLYILFVLVYSVCTCIFCLYLYILLYTYIFCFLLKYSFLYLSIFMTRWWNSRTTKSNKKQKSNYQVKVCFADVIITAYFLHYNRMQVHIYGITFMSKMITLPEMQPKPTLSPENERGLKSRLWEGIQQS